LRATVPACLGLILGCVGLSAARAADLRVSLAVPLPLAVYGYINSGGGGGGDGGGLEFLGSVGLDLALPFAQGSDLALSLWADGSLIAGSDGETTALIYFAATGVGIAWRPSLNRDVALYVALGPAVVASGIVVDEDLRLDTWSLGGRAAAALDIAIAEDVTVGPWVSFTVTGAPLNEDVWFNRPLRGTRYFSAGVSLRVEL